MKIFFTKLALLPLLFLTVNLLAQDPSVEVEHNKAVEAAKIVNNGTKQSLTVDNNSADEAVFIKQSGNGEGILIDQDGNQAAICIDNDGTTNQSLKIDNASSNEAVFILQNGNGEGILIDQNGNQPALSIDNDGAANQSVLIDNASANEAVSIIQNGNGEGILIDQNGNQAALSIDNDGAANQSVLIDNASANEAVFIKQTGNGEGILIDQDGNGDALSIDNDGNKTGINVLNKAGAGDAILVVNMADTTGICINQAGMGEGLKILNVGTKQSVVISHDAPSEAVFIHQINTGESLVIQHDSPADGVAVVNTAGGKAIKVVSPSGTAIDAETENHNVEIGIPAGPGGRFKTSTTPMGASAEPTLETINDADGNSALIRTIDLTTTKATLKVENDGLGNAVNVESRNIDAETALYVEVLDISTVAAKGRVAHFNQSAGAALTAAENTVLISSSSLDPAHSSLDVIPASPTLQAANFEGNVDVATDLDVGMHLSSMTSNAGVKSFKIDHPLDPYNKYLYHSVVESPDMMNIYNGNISTDANGYATVELPHYFEALNMDFRYQLTVIGNFAQAIVKRKVSNNQFTIQTNQPNIEVSWQVTGIRKDRIANERRIKVEQEKEAEMKGKLLYQNNH